MRRSVDRLWLPVLLVGICAWLALTKAQLGEYQIDAGTAVDNLARGDLSAYFAWHPMMGPLGTLFQTPWSLLGGGEMSRYQWATFGCLLPLAALAWYLSTIAARRGVNVLGRTTIAVVILVNPLTFEALRFGHPEEFLTTALALGAVIAAIEERSIPAAILLGLAIATKQWAALAILPVLMALPSRRIFAAVLAGSIVFAFNLPYLLVNSGALLTTTDAAAHGSSIASTWSLWYAVHEPVLRYLPGLGMWKEVQSVPTLVQPYTHLLIMVLMFAVPLAIAAWRRSWRLVGGEAVALFALLALLRCVLDPNDNSYYNFSLLVSLCAWDAMAPTGRAPLRTLLGLAAAICLVRWTQLSVSWALMNACYLTLVGLCALAIVVSLRRRKDESALLVDGELAGA